MRRLPILLALLVGCAAPRSKPPETPPPKEPSSPPGTYERILEDYLARRPLQDQTKELESTKWYDMAVRYKSYGKLSQAKTAVDRALEIWPWNRRARKLKSELDAILGTGFRLPNEEFEWRTRAQLVDVMNLLNAGERYLAAGEKRRAHVQFERAEVQIMALPSGVPERGMLLTIVREYAKRCLE
jgi:hypothetical protein